MADKTVITDASKKAAAAVVMVGAAAVVMVEAAVVAAVITVVSGLVVLVMSDMRVKLLSILNSHKPGEVRPHLSQNS